MLRLFSRKSSVSTGECRHGFTECIVSEEDLGDEKSFYRVDESWGERPKIKWQI